jgi:hypothetical protein
MGDADINEMGNPRVARHSDGFKTGFEIYFLEFAAFARAGVSNTDELDKCIGTAEQVAIGGAIECVADRHIAALWQVVA